MGITNIVNHSTAVADELSADQLIAGAARLRRKVLRYRPRFLALLGISAYRTAFGQRKARLGLQEERTGGTRLWLLPHPSGLNAHHQLAGLAKLFGELRKAAGAGS